MTTPATLPTAHDVLVAYQRIGAFVARTPLEQSLPLSSATGADVYLKLECAQVTGSFKVRGATNALLSDDQRRPVVACSAGNHALGVAHAALHTGTQATLVLPANASTAKIAALRRYPVELVLHGHSYDDAETEALRLAHEGWRFLSPYNDPDVIAGQGTVGVEMLEQLPNADVLLVGVGGGGLISGVGLWAKAVNPAMRVIGIQAEVSAVMTASLKAGHMVTLADDQPSLADGLAGGVEANTITLGLMQRLVDTMILVSEQQIAAAMCWLLNEHHLVVEGAGAVGVAALLSGLVPDIVGKRVFVLLCGRNVATSSLLQHCNE